MMQTIVARDAIQTREVAARLGVGVERVRQLERAGVLMALKLSSGVRIYSAEAVEKLRRAREFAKRPPRR